MARLVMLLVPPRSFSSLVSTMIGQHPEMYGFPELHVMMRETIGEALVRERRRDQFLGPSGLLRALAELEFGGQSAENVLNAANWLEDRSDWKSKDVINYVVDLAAQKTGAKFCVEKTPSMMENPIALERVRRSFPDALFIHVTRHPANHLKSINEYIDKYIPRHSPEVREQMRKRAIGNWPVTHRNILDFCQSLAPGQYIRIRGEDVLSNATGAMRQVAGWLGLRTDDDAIAAMLRPEDSPYACLGPPNATFGNDPKFVFSPAFRAGNPRLPSMESFLQGPEAQRLDEPRREYLAQLAYCLGYH